METIEKLKEQLAAKDKELSDLREQIADLKEELKDAKNPGMWDMGLTPTE